MSDEANAALRQYVVTNSSETLMLHTAVVWLFQTITSPLSASERDEYLQEFLTRVDEIPPLHDAAPATTQLFEETLAQAHVHAAVLVAEVRRWHETTRP